MAEDRSRPGMPVDELIGSASFLYLVCFPFVPEGYWLCRIRSCPSYSRSKGARPRHVAEDWNVRIGLRWNQVVHEVVDLDSGQRLVQLRNRSRPCVVRIRIRRVYEVGIEERFVICLLYTSDAADE